MKRWVSISVLGTVACGGPVANPLVEAHRGGSGYWPANSRAAVQGSVAADFDGLHVDVVLTQDGHAVLSQDPWLDPARCTDADGGFLKEPVRIDRVDLRELQRDYLCGGIPHDDFPNAEVLAEPMLSLDDMIALLADASAGMRIHLDLGVEKGWTPPVEDFLEPVLDRWWAADRPQTIAVSANTAAALLAFEQHARAVDRDLHSTLVYPFVPAEDGEAVGIRGESRSFLGQVDYVAMIEDASADGIAVHYATAERGELAQAQDAGYETGLWTLNEPGLREDYSRWPVDVMITDYPGTAP